MSNAVRPDDMLLSLLLLSPTKARKFNAMTQRIHEVLYRVKSAHCSLLQAFVFNTATVFPYSTQVATSLRSLQASRLIGMENPDFRVYFVKSSADEVFAKYVEPRLDSATREELRIASEQFWSELSVG